MLLPIGIIFGSIVVGAGLFFYKKRKSNVETSTPTNTAVAVRGSLVKAPVSNTKDVADEVDPSTFSKVDITVNTTHDSNGKKLNSYARKMLKQALLRARKEGVKIVRITMIKQHSPNGTASWGLDVIAA